MPTASDRAERLLVSACTEVSTLLAALASVVVIVASTLTLAAVTVSEMSPGSTSTAVARPLLKPSWSNDSTVPATMSASSITDRDAAPGGSGGGGNGGGGSGGASG